MIKVIIERQLLEGLEQEYRQASQALLQACMESPGYISGESLVDLRRPNRRIIITQWNSESAWRAWEVSDKRQQLLGGIAGILANDEKVTLLAPIS
ncbi:Antibiotic biosynthesis monooxygenase [Marinospirillum celere]|uniref:Antibiotic biosynthesis monooxygenase n=1 Tax=Marinospirillum celere TaxID=1122252 RepID=A0A1I1EWX4_9GAMM|nr:antibiotic biosynthesis monooxygenase [Marinospirillum celere]SFB91531.1 Antibiotic biosynthesis monooxygenase [Marinospirillum celere]